MAFCNKIYFAHFLAIVVVLIVKAMGQKFLRDHILCIFPKWFWVKLCIFPKMSYKWPIL